MEMDKIDLESKIAALKGLLNVKRQEPSTIVRLSKAERIGRKLDLLRESGWSPAMFAAIRTGEVE